MIKKFATLVSLLLVIAVVAAACSKGNNGGSASQSASQPASQPASSASSEAPSGETVKLRFATWDDGETLKIQTDIAKKFEESHPGIKVQVESYGDGFDQKLAASFGANDAPDIMYMWDFPTYYHNLEPLDDLIAGDSSLGVDDIYPALFNYVKIDNKSYGMPSGFTTRVMYYNKKLFDDAKVPYPQEGWTWEQFAETAKKLSDPSKKQFGFGIRAENDPYDMQGFVWSNGGSFISPDGKTVEGYMNSPETIEVFQKFGSLLKDKSAVIVGGKNQQSGNDIFKAGKIAMWESGIWPLNSFKEAKIDVGTATMPVFNGKPLKGVVSESAVAMSKNSEHKKEAWEFIKYFASDEAIKMRTSDLPIRKSVVAEQKLDQDPLYTPFYRMLEMSDNTPAFLLSPNWNKVNSKLTSAIDAVMQGQDASEALNAAVKDSARFMK